jgi:hypothetical protein
MDILMSAAAITISIIEVPGFHDLTLKFKGAI